MQTDTDDHLQRLFPRWRLNRRVIIWLWLTLQDKGMDLSCGSVDTAYTRDRMADYISDKDLVRSIEHDQSLSFLPEQDLNWIEKTGRQNAWLLQEYLKKEEKELASRQHPLLTYPTLLTPREELIARLDFLNIRIDNKQDILTHLKTAWVKHKTQDKYFAWYSSAGKEKLKCKIAWQWYQDNHRWSATTATEFSKLEDVLEFLDGTDFNLEEKRFQLSEIKKKFKAQETATNRTGKKQTNLSLSDQARKQLEQLAKNERLSKTEVIELLIGNAFESGRIKL